MPPIAAIANPNLMALTDGAVNQDIPRLSNVHRVPDVPVGLRHEVDAGDDRVGAVETLNRRV